MQKGFAGFIFFIFAVCGADCIAQSTPSWSVGLSVGGVSGVNESIHQSVNPQILANVLWLDGIAPHWSVEANVGTGKLSSPTLGSYSEYSTSIIPIDIRFRFAPLDNSEWQPYIYAGVGLLSYAVSSAPPNSAPDAKLSGTTMYLPVGIGIYHRIDRSWGVDLGIGDHPVLTDNLNPVHDGKNDGFWGFTVGIHFTPAAPGDDEDNGFDFGVRGTTRILATVAFDSATSRLRSESEPILNQILAGLNKHDEYEVEFRSYVDDSYDFYTSMALTQERVQTMKVWLVSRGISVSRISTQAYGPHNPLVPNTTPENRKRNERIEIVRMK